MAHPPRSREEIAKFEIGHTEATRGVQWFLLLFFVLLITAVPLLQNARELAAIRAGLYPGRQLPQCWDVFGLLWPQGAELKAIGKAGHPAAALAAAKVANNRILHDIKDYETALKDRDTVVQGLIPHMQTVITGRLKGGNEDAYCGRDGWLFYRRDIDSLTGHGFLEATVLKQRATAGSELQAPQQPDPVKAIIDFRDQLARRGIMLIVVPAPVKPSLYPECDSARYAGQSQVVQNPSFAAFTERLAQAHVALFDPAPLLAAAKAAAPQTPLYLQTDTHWTPPAVALTATQLAAFARRAVVLSPPQAAAFATVAKPVTNLGDIAVMLHLPSGQRSYLPETVQTEQVLNGSYFWRPTPAAEVLLLGDSFTNIYSLEPMGWGESAGFAEHLSAALGLPLDALCRNDAGSHATREMLAKELQRGNDRLAGKKLVIWEFAARELACGDWKMLELKTPAEIAAIRAQAGSNATFFVPAAGSTVAASGTVTSASPVPRPGSVPYKDHILAIHLTDVQGVTTTLDRHEAVVYMWSMRDSKLTRAARFRPGDRVTLNLKPWAEVTEKFDAINRSELADDALQLQEPNWAEEITK